MRRLPASARCPCEPLLGSVEASMTKLTGPIHGVVSDNLLRLLRASADFVNVILDTPDIREQYGGVCGRDALLDILRSLVVLTGSDEAAVEWLFYSHGFTKVAGDDAYLALEYGDFWSLKLMKDWLHILEAHRTDCPDLIGAIFGKSAP